MLQVHISEIAAIDVLETKLLPQRTVVSVSFNDSNGRSIELWSHSTRSYPTLAEAEAEGAKFFEGLPEALSGKQAEQLALEWVKANVLDVKNGFDRRLLYAKPKSGYCLIGT